MGNKNILTSYYFQLRDEINDIQLHRANLKNYKIIVITTITLVIFLFVDEIEYSFFIFVPTFFSFCIDLILNSYTAAIIRIAEYNKNICEPKITHELDLPRSFCHWEDFMSRIPTYKKLSVSFLANFFFTSVMVLISFHVYANRFDASWIVYMFLIIIIVLDFLSMFMSSLVKTKENLTYIGHTKKLNEG